MQEITEYFNGLKDKLIIADDVLQEIVSQINVNPSKNSILTNLKNIINSESQFKLIELDMWLKNFSFDYNVQAFEDDNLIRIIKTKIYKIEPNSLRVDTDSCGVIQFRVPPNTLKKAMKLNKPIAQYYVITEGTFYNGINYIDIAFPIFENFFMHNFRKTVFLCINEDLKRRVEVLANEELFGPTLQDFIDAGMDKTRAENFFKELKLFAFPIKENDKVRNAVLSDYVEIYTFENNRLKINDVEIVKENNRDVFTIKENNKFFGKVDLSNWEPVSIEEEFSLKEPGKDAEFGVYFFDPSTGFDPDRLTSSFIVWIGNGQGMVVDPLTNLPQYLDRKRINRNDIKYVFLTHVHSDHDDGLLEEILSGKIITLITSRLVFNSFIRKVKAVTGWDEERIQKLILFKEIKEGEKLKLNDKTYIEINYGFHSIPTCRFVITYTDSLKSITKSISYSGDTNFNPEYVNKLVGEGKLTQERADEILGFIWDADLIIHDTGGGIHTDIKTLLTLPEELQKKIIAIHSHEVPTGSYIRQAHKGEEIILVKADKIEQYKRLARQLDDIALFNKLPAEQKLEIMEASQREKYYKGDSIIKLGEAAKRFYIIHSGEVEIITQDNRKIYLGKGDYFGEMAFFNDNKSRNANIYAKTDVELLSLSEDLFNKYRTLILDTYHNIVENRPLLSNIYFFKMLGEKEINTLASMFESKEFKKGDFIIKYGEIGSRFYIVKSGLLDVFIYPDNKNKKLINQLGKGDTFGEIALIENTKRTADVVVASEYAEVIMIDKDTFEKITAEYPGVALGVEEIKKRYKKNEER